MTNDFEYYAPTKVVFGHEAENRTAALIREFGGTKVLLHYGQQSAVKSGLIDKMRRILEEGQIPYVELGGVVPNPLLSKVYEGIGLCKKEQVDFVLAVGGGSVIDSAKAICYGMADERDVWELFTKSRKAIGCMALGVVLTIAATGSETSNSCVITKDETRAKRSYNDNVARPKFAVMDPELTMSLPDYQTQSGCSDILMHTMERYFTNDGNMEITDRIAEGLLKTVMHHAKILHEDPENYDSRAEVMWAGSLSHTDLTGCGNKRGDFASHMLEHELGGMFDVAHGAGLTAVWGSWARYVYKNCLHRFVRFAEQVMDIPAGGTDEETALKGIEALEDFFRSVGMPVTLEELGVQPTEEQLQQMLDGCVQSSGGSKGSAMVLHRDDMEAIYRMAMR